MERDNAVSMKQRRSRTRGASLLVTTALLVVLSLVAIAVVNRASTESESVSAKRHYDRMVSCADGARQMLFSQFSAFGASMTELTLNTVIDGKQHASGHFDSFNVQSVEPAEGVRTGGTGLSDSANRIAKSSLGGVPYRVTVVCRDSNRPSRQSEVEFMVRFGL